MTAGGGCREIGPAKPRDVEGLGRLGRGDGGIRGHFALQARLREARETASASRISGSFAVWKPAGENLRGGDSFWGEISVHPLTRSRLQIEVGPRRER